MDGMNGAGTVDRRLICSLALDVAAQGVCVRVDGRLEEY